jgi:exopolysaccharide biosynthesis WecB/TagA/CpsF family protein
MNSLLNAKTVRLLGLDIADASLSEVAETLNSRPSERSFSYIITPNADHYVRLGQHRDRLMPHYRTAGTLLLDSRVIRLICRAFGLRVPSIVTGSDLTKELFDRWIDADEPVTIIGTTKASVARLRQTYSLTRVAHFAPPFGFESNPQIVDQCVQFVRTHPARFVFLACGAPRQELLAHCIVEAGGASGIGLCIGAAIDQIGGFERRAPEWMRRAGLEWSWRIAREPKRMGRRYWQDLAIVPALIRERIARS